MSVKIDKNIGKEFETQIIKRLPIGANNIKLGKVDNVKQIIKLKYTLNKKEEVGSIHFNVFM